MMGPAIDRWPTPKSKRPTQSGSKMHLCIFGFPIFGASGPFFRTPRTNSALHTRSRVVSPNPRSQLRPASFFTPLLGQFQLPVFPAQAISSFQGFCTFWAFSCLPAPARGFFGKNQYRTPRFRDVSPQPREQRWYGSFFAQLFGQFQVALFPVFPSFTSFTKKYNNIKKI